MEPMRVIVTEEKTHCCCEMPNGDFIYAKDLKELNKLFNRMGYQDVTPTPKPIYTTNHKD